MRTFKVMQFNMQFGQMWDESDPDHAPINLDLTIAEILKHDADIIMLQEVERAPSGGVQIEPPPNYTRLKAALKGYHSYFSYPKADSRELPFGIGLAIFSRTPLHDSVNHNLPSPPIEFVFGGKKTTPTDRLLICSSTIIDGHDVQLFNTHLLAHFMLNSTCDQHLDQRRLVVELLRQSTRPSLIAGDFNVSNHESLVRQFNEIGFETVQVEEVTWRHRPYVLDHIFYSPQLLPVSYQVIPTLASDHHVLIAEFGFAE